MFGVLVSVIVSVEEQVKAVMEMDEIEEQCIELKSKIIIWIK